MKKIILSMLFIFSIQSLSAQSISVQGVLRDNNNRAVPDKVEGYDMTFKLYSAESGGGVLWEQDKNDVNVLNGVYSIVLDIGTEIQNSTGQLWMEVSVDGETMGQRVRLHLSPYEYYTITDGSNSVPASGNVGIGTDDPEAKLDVRGDVRFYGTYGDGETALEIRHDNQYLDISSHHVGGSHQYSKIQSSGYQGSHTALEINPDGGDILFNSNNEDGGVGIGIPFPHEDAKLDVNGEVRIANRDQLPSYNVSGSTLFPSKLFLANPFYGPAIWSEMHHGRYQDGVDFHIGNSNSNNASYKSYFSIFGKGGRIGMGRGDEPGTYSGDGTGAYNFQTPNPGHMHVNIADRWGFGTNGYWSNIFVRGSTTDLGYTRVYFYGESHEGDKQDVGINAGSYSEFDNSSVRENARTITYGLTTVMSLAPKEYNYVHNPERNHVGFVAQEVEQFLPEVISRPVQEGDPYSISYTRFTPVLTKAIQELKTEKDAEIEALNQTIEDLIKRIEELENK